MLIPKLSAPLLRAGRDEGAQDHAAHEPGDRDPLTFAQYKMKNVTGTSFVD